jgi:hypothetical protein
MSAFVSGYELGLWLVAGLGLWRVWKMRQRGELGTLSERLRNPLVWVPFLFLFEALMVSGPAHP